MTDVLTLFDPEFGTFEAEAQRPLTLKERFTIFHISNPQVFKALERMTQQMVDRGRTRFSLKTATEVLRWDWYMTTVGDEPFKLNNSFVSLYTRLMIDLHPEWQGLFELRELRSDE